MFLLRGHLPPRCNQKFEARIAIQQTLQLIKINSKIFIMLTTVNIFFYLTCSKLLKSRVWFPQKYEAAQPFSTFIIILNVS